MNYFDSHALLEPRHLTAPAPWAGHIPFASWLIAKLRPGILVELGAYSGISYLAFCQAIESQKIPTQTFAVDTWEGDVHAGAYDETVFQTLRRAHDPHYSHFSSLLRMTFDEALDQFTDASVDLLHIDGLHTYDAVKHDFDTWLPKMSSRGVVLFHDTQVFRDDFGVYRLWAELSSRYPSIEFPHSNGLGVLLVGTEQSPELLALCAPQERGSAIRAFSLLGARLERQADLLILQTQLKDAQEREGLLQQAGQQRHEWIEHLDFQLLDAQRRLQQLDHALAQSAERGKHLQQALADRDAVAQQFTHELALLKSQLIATKAELAEVYASRSWRVTAGLRSAGKLARHWGIARFLRRARNAAAYAVRGQWRTLAQRIVSTRKEAAAAAQLARAPVEVRRIGIIATPHTLFVAHQLDAALQKAGFTVTVATEPPVENFELDLYIVICPQMFKRLPPGEKRVVFQMEQSVSSRWFTDPYIHTLENSLAVLDYAETNLRYLAGRGVAYPHTYLVPVGGVANYRDYLKAHSAPSPAEPPCDVLFYGDANTPRRQQMLDAIGARYHLRVVGNLFGPALHRAMANARVVVNLHYYEGALLETTRIYECLSLGLPVVSETSADQSAHQGLQNAVRFVPVGDSNALLDAIGDVLGADDAERAAAHVQREAVVRDSQTHTEFMLYRMLLARRWMTYSRFQQLTADVPMRGDRLALSLPETTERRSAFLSHNAAGIKVFDGLRYSPGWVGCALSYKHLAHQALATGMKQLEVMEDDVVFPEDYLQRKAAVDAYLQRHDGQWDAFVGLVAIVHPDTRVLAVHREAGQTFVTIDRMMSMVHNIYAPRALQMLAAWDESCIDPEVNTIDRYLQSQGELRVVTTLPFLVGHQEDLHSSLWGIQNSQYSEIIKTAEAQLHQLVLAYEQASY